MLLRGFFSLFGGGWAHGGARGGRDPDRETGELERVLACAVCGVHVPESEGVNSAGEFFCCDAHRRMHRDSGDQ